MVISNHHVGKSLVNSKILQFWFCISAMNSISIRVSLFCDMSDIAIWSDMDHFSSNSEIFTLRYGNLYFAIWESLFCDMILHKVKTEIFTLRYEKIYFALWDTNCKTPKNVFCDMGHKFRNSKISYFGNQHSTSNRQTLYNH